MTLAEILLVTAVAISGALFVAAFWHRGAIGGSFLAAPIGVAMYSLVGLALFAVGAFSTLSAVLVSFSIGLVVIGASIVRRRVDLPRAVRIVGMAVAWSVVALVVATVTTWTRFTPDSIDYLTIAGSVERFGSLPPLEGEELLKRQWVTAALQTFGVVTGRGYLSSLITLAVGSGTAWMIWLGIHALRDRSVIAARALAAAGIVGVFVISTNRVLYHHFYVNGHGVFAALLVIAIGILWWAANDDRWTAAPLAAIAVAAIVPLRAEGIIVLVFFLVPTLVAVSTPVWVRWTLVLPAGVTAFVWNGVVLRDVLPADEFDLTSTPVLTMAIGAGLVVLVAATHIPMLRRLLVWVPAVGFALLALYTAARVYRGSAVFYDTLDAMGGNLAGAGLWGTFWWFAPLALVACIAIVRVPFQDRFMWGLAAYPIVLLASAYLRGSAYRLGPGDSANRMLIHVVFVIGLYLIVAVGLIADAVGDEEWSLRAAGGRLADTLRVRP